MLTVEQVYKLLTHNTVKQVGVRLQWDGMDVNLSDDSPMLAAFKGYVVDEVHTDNGLSYELWLKREYVKVGDAR